MRERLSSEQGEEAGFSEQMYSKEGTPMKCSFGRGNISPINSPTSYSRYSTHPFCDLKELINIEYKHMIAKLFTVAEKPLHNYINDIFAKCLSCLLPPPTGPI